MKKFRSAAGIAAGLLALLALLLRPGDALAGVSRGVSLCAQVIVPSLFPFFVISSLLGSLGVPGLAGRALTPLMSRAFGVSGRGAAALAAGLLGGYPLGAAAAADLVRRGELSPREGERLLPFCNNSGPAFILGAAGIGVFGSAKYGFALYACHALAAVTAGVLLRPRGGTAAAAPARTVSAPAVPDPGGALADAVRASVGNILSVCGFVVTFTALCGVLDGCSLLPGAALFLARLTGRDVSAARALLIGALELGGGIGALRGAAPTPGNLALCAFLLGWGGASVHFQTAAVCAGTGMKTARHTAGRLLVGALSAGYILLLSPAL